MPRCCNELTLCDFDARAVSLKVEAATIPRLATAGLAGHGLHTLHGLWPALIASSRLLKDSRFLAAIFFAHAQVGLWNGSRLAEATYAVCVWSAVTAVSTGKASAVVSNMAASASFVSAFIFGSQWGFRCLSAGSPGWPPMSGDRPSVRQGFAHQSVSKLFHV